MAGEKDKNAGQKYRLGVLFQHMAQSQQDICDHSEHKTGCDHPGGIRTVGTAESENDKAEACQPLEYAGACKAVLLFFKDAVGRQ